MVNKAKIEELAADAVDSVAGEWGWKLTKRERDLAIMAATRASASAVAIALMEEREN